MTFISLRTFYQKGMFCQKLSLNLLRWSYIWSKESRHKTIRTEPTWGSRTDLTHLWCRNHSTCCCHWRWPWLEMHTKKSSGLIEILCILISVITQVYTFVKIHEAVNIEIYACYCMQIIPQLLAYKVLVTTCWIDFGPTNGLQPSIWSSLVHRTCRLGKWAHVSNLNVLEALQNSSSKYNLINISGDELNKNLK